MTEKPLGCSVEHASSEKGTAGYRFPMRECTHSRTHQDDSVPSISSVSRKIVLSLRQDLLIPERQINSISRGAWQRWAEKIRIWDLRLSNHFHIVALLRICLSAWQLPCRSPSWLCGTRSVQTPTTALSHCAQHWTLGKHPIG